MYHIRVRACALIIEDNYILLVEFNDEKGFHYNLPVGGTEPGESIIEAVKREAREEANADVDVGSPYPDHPFCFRGKHNSRFLRLQKPCTVH